MNPEEPLIDQKFVLEKFPGKGGWTYARIPEVIQNKNNPFGWVTVKGFIDNYELNQYKLMPLGNGKLFLPVKAEIRKFIGKYEGDTVHVKLFADNSETIIPEEIILCLENESNELYENFIALTNSERKAYIDWIYAARKAETRAKRIAKMMQKLFKKENFYD